MPHHTVDTYFSWLTTSPNREIMLRKEWNTKYRNDSHFGIFEQVQLREQFVEKLEKEIDNDE